MKKKLFAILLLFVILLRLDYAFAQDDDSGLGGIRIGTRSAQFLNLGMSPRALAMGNSFTTLANGPSAIFENPAGLALSEKKSVYVSYFDYLTDVNIYTVAVVIPRSDWYALGFSFMSLSTGDIEETTVANPEGTGRIFSVSDFSLGVAWSAFMFDRLSVGIGFKYFGENLAELESRSFAFDIGTNYDTGYKGVRIAMSIQNFGPDIGVDGTFLGVDFRNVELTVKDFESFAIPLILKFGASFDAWTLGDHKLTTTSEIHNAIDSGLRANFGSEYSFQNKYFLRTGYRLDQDELGLSFGGGVHLPLKGWGDIKVNYGFLEFGRFDSVQIISIEFGI